MTARSSAGSTTTRTRWFAPAGFAALFVAILLVGSAIAPYLFKVATLRDEVAEQLRVTLGLHLTAEEGAHFDLLPRPHLVMNALRVDDPAGTIGLTAETLDGEVRLLPLIVGRVELSSITLIRPVLTIDLDGRPMAASSTIGHALRRSVGDAPITGEQRLGTVTLVDGTAHLRGKALSQAPLLRGIDATIDWRDVASPATLTGQITVGDTSTTVAAWIAQPFRLMRGDRSTVTLDLQSAPLDLTANGEIGTGATTSYRGRLSATAVSLPALLRLCGLEPSLPAPFSNLTLAGDAAITLDPTSGTVVDLPNLHVHSDGNDYEGTLAYQGGNGRRTLSGTLAADQLSLAPFMERASPAIGTSAPAAPSGKTLDLDLRISAAHMRVPPFTLDDGALAVMTRGERTEVGVVEAKAYGGTLRGRISFGADPEGLNVRAAGTLVGADAATLGWDALGRQVATGTLSASANLETTGAGIPDLLAHLQGWVKTSASDGDISGIDLGRGLRETERRRPEGVASALRTGRTSFTDIHLETRLADGVATVENGLLRGPSGTLALTGDADLARRTLDLQAVASPPAADRAAGLATPNLAVTIGGTFERASIQPENAAAGAPPP